MRDAGRHCFDAVAYQGAACLLGKGSELKALDGYVGEGRGGRGGTKEQA
jgi:hypothetical protein